MLLKIKKIKYITVRKFKFILNFISQFLKIDNWKRFIKFKFWNSNGKLKNISDYDVNIALKILDDSGYNEFIDVLFKISITGNIKKSIKIIESISDSTRIKKIKIDLIWRLMHYKGMESHIAALGSIFEDNPLWKIPKARIIDFHGGEYFAIISEGLSIKSILDNAKDEFNEDINNAEVFNDIDPSKLALLRNLKLKRNKHKMKSGALSDTNNLDLSFQATGLVLGRIFGKSLWADRPLASSHSYVIQLDAKQQPYIFVKFDDVEPWYLMVGSFRGTKNYIYLPERNIVILLRSLDNEWYSIHDYIEGFQHHAQKNCQIFNHYLSSNTKPAIYSGAISNLGHFFWNEVQGIYNAIKEGVASQISEVVLYKFQYINLENLFPEFESLALTKLENSDDVFVKCIERSLFCTHPTALSMTSDCAALIREISWNLADPEQRQLINDSKADEIKFWFNLRSHNKTWLNQVEGVQIICDYLLEQYSTVTLVLDGMPDCNDLVGEIKARLQGRVRLIDCTSTALENSISWASVVDFYIATIGSGLTINTWVAEKSGVAHSERSHIKQLDMWKDVRPDIILPLVPNSAQIFEVGGGAYCDYSINPRIILNLVKKLKI